MFDTRLNSQSEEHSGVLVFLQSRLLGVTLYIAATSIQALMECEGRSLGGAAEEDMGVSSPWSVGLCVLPHP